MRLPYIVLLALTWPLTACSLAPYYSQIKAVADTGIATAVKDRQEFNDKKLAVNLVALCDSSIGAVNRYPDASVRDFVNQMCGGNPQSVTLERLSEVLRLVDQVKGMTAPITLAPVTEGPVVEPSAP